MITIKLTSTHWEMISTDFDTFQLKYFSWIQSKWVEISSSAFCDVEYRYTMSLHHNYVKYKLWGIIWLQNNTFRLILTQFRHVSTWCRNACRNAVEICRMQSKCVEIDSTACYITAYMCCVIFNNVWHTPFFIYYIHKKLSKIYG